MGYDQELRDLEHLVFSVPWELRKNLAALSQNGAVHSVLATLTRSIHEKQRLARPYQRKKVFIGSGIFLVDSAVSILIKAGVGYFVFQGTLSVGMVTMSVLYADRLASAIRQATEAYFDIRKTRFDFSFFEEFLKISAPVGSKRGFGSIGSGISFRNVSFSYPDSRELERPFFELIERQLKIMKAMGDYPWQINRLQDELLKFENGKGESEGSNMPVFENFHFEFVPGNVYGIVGKNGAGKTTLVNLISGFFHSYGGEILFDGKNIRDWTNEGFSNVISVISQIPYTYGVYGDSTVRNNLLLGVDRKVSDEELFLLLHDFRLDRKIRKSPKGIDSEIEKDIHFS